ncbi:MAG: hypothetical protein H6732_10985 [Alphaproteobacteria bacterium]|nr:hypothetical protein [Alphaproteobacteria bacterium]
MRRSTHRHVPLLATLALLGCAGDPAAGDNPPGEQPGASQRVLHGQVTRDDPALGGTATLAAAAEVELTSQVDGLTTLHGSAGVATDGSFTLDAEGMDDRAHYVLQAVDADGTVIGAVDFDGEDSADDLRIDAAGSVTAMVWAHAEARGEPIADDAWLGSQLTGEVVASVQALDDAGADLAPLFEVMASAAAGADDARAAFVTDLGVQLAVVAEASERAEAFAAGSSIDAAAALDVELDAEGFSPEERTSLATVAGAAFRTSLQRELPRGDVGQDDALRAVIDATLVSEAHAVAAAAGEQPTTDGPAARLMADVSAWAALTAQAIDQGAAPSVALPAFRAQVGDRLSASLQEVLTGSLDDTTRLDLILGLEGGVLLDDTARADATEVWLRDLRARFEAEVLGAAAATPGDAQALAEAVLSARADVRAELEAYVATLGDGVDREAWIHALLALTLTGTAEAG